MNVKFTKHYGKHPNIGRWFEFTIIPSIVIAKYRGWCLTEEEINKYGTDFIGYVLEINVLCYSIKITHKTKRK